MLLIVQFLGVKNNKSMYNLQSKTVNCYSQNSLHDTPHLKAFCFNNHVFLIIFVISYVHLGFMLHLLLFNESLLHYLSIMCVTMMVFCVCMNASACGEATCDEL